MTIKTLLILLISIIFIQSLARAEDVVTTVFNVIESKKTQRLLILSGVDGRVYKMARNEANLARMKSFKGQVVKISSDKELTVKSIRLASSSEVDLSTMDLNRFRYNELREFTPTDLQSFEKADGIFKDMLNDGDRSRSECFKRAHMWAYDMWSKLSINSQKIYMFYTQRFIQLEDFDWWFHVAPMVVVNGEEYVLDGTFMTEPVTLNAWKNFFMKSEKLNCPLIDKIQQYDNAQWTRLCYLMKTSMYYFSPKDIQERDLEGKQKNHWVLEELQDARRAFKNYDELYEGLDSGKPTIKY